VERLLAATNELMGKARQNPNLAGVFTTYSANSPQLYLEIDRQKAQMLNVPIPSIFETLQVNLGTAYVNDFNAFGRIYQVRAQADQRFRMEPDDINRLRVRSSTGALVPLGTLAEVREVTGPELVQRYNMYTSVPLQGGAAPGVSSVRRWRPWSSSRARPSAGYDVRVDGAGVSGARNRQHGGLHLRPVSAVRVPCPGAQYESWSLPLAIMLIVPMAVLSALAGVMLVGQDNNILTQIGLVVLVGLAAKNAILIVEFAREAEARDGKDPIEAVVEGVPAAPAPHPDDRLRLHPRRHAVGDRHGSGRRNAPLTRHRGVLRHAGRNGIRAVLHARLLRGDPAAHAALLPQAANGRQGRRGGIGAHTRLIGTG
jgi:HAE1 family hydrophobic/amphiphilic exporter-1